jgi:hypothetical protein
MQLFFWTHTVKQTHRCTPCHPYMDSRNFLYTHFDTFHFIMCDSLTLFVKDESNKLECYIRLECKCLSGTKTLADWTNSSVTMKTKCCEYDPRDQVHNTSFASERINGSNKLSCYIALGWKSLPVTNTLAYRTH